LEKLRQLVDVVLHVEQVVAHAARLIDAQDDVDGSLLRFDLGLRAALTLVGRIGLRRTRAEVRSRGGSFGRRLFRSEAASIARAAARRDESASEETNDSKQAHSVPREVAK